jgi:hypothetical protein
MAEEPAPGLTFKEKSLWVTLVSTIAIFGYYFARALQLDDVPVLAGALFAGVVIVFAVLHAVVHAALALHKSPEPTDERDRLVSAKAARISYIVLMTGVWGALSVAALQLGTYWVAQAALLAIMLGEVSNCAAQLIYYRRGA